MDYYFALIDLADLIGVFIYLIIVYFILYKWKFNYKNANLSKYIIAAFTLRILSSFFHYYIAQFVYKSGDVFFYVRNIKIYTSVYRADLSLLPEVLFNNFSDLRPGIKSMFEVSFETYAKPTVLIAKAGSIIGLFCNDNFLCISITFSLLSAVGIWKLYVVFADMYPHLHKQLAYGILFLPSIFFWGSGLAKDPLCIFGLGMLVFYFYQIAIKKKLSIINILLFILGAYVLLIIKPYILFAFFPSLLVWLFFHYNAKIKSAFLKKVNTVFISIILVGVIFSFLNNISASEDSDVSKFAVDNLFDEIKQQQEGYIGLNNVESNSFVTIGDFDQSFSGLIKMFPLAINLTLFRPYLWEVRNPLMLLSAAESLYFFLFLLFVFFKGGIIKSLKIIFTTPVLLASFIFVIIFSGFIGISTFNFGTIARYKIPALPFLFLILIVLYDKIKNRKAMLVKKPKYLSVNNNI